MNLVMAACTLSFRFGAILSKHMARLRNEIHKLPDKVKKRTKEWHANVRTGSQVTRGPQESPEPEESEEQRSTDSGPLPGYQRYVTLSVV